MGGKCHFNPPDVTRLDRWFVLPAVRHDTVHFPMHMTLLGNPSAHFPADLSSPSSCHSPLSVLAEPQTPFWVSAQFHDCGPNDSSQSCKVRRTRNAISKRICWCIVGAFFSSYPPGILSLVTLLHSLSFSLLNLPLPVRVAVTAFDAFVEPAGIIKKCPPPSN